MYTKIHYLLLITGTLICGSVSFSQENPWKTTKQKENPWATEEVTVESPQESTTKENQTTQSVPSDSSTIIEEQDEVQTLPTRDVAIIERGTRSSLILIEREAQVSYPARGAFAGSFLTALALNIFSVPVNAIFATAPTPKANQYKRSFEEQNPEATEAEKRAFRRGIRKKRAGRAAAGTGYGILGQILIIIGFSI